MVMTCLMVGQIYASAPSQTLPVPFSKSKVSTSSSSKTTTKSPKESVSKRPTSEEAIKLGTNYPDIAYLLGWNPQSSASNMCSGYYRESPSDYSLKPIPGTDNNPSKNPTQIQADNTIFQRGGRSVLTGDVLVAQLGRQLQADKAVLYPPAGSKKTQVQVIDLFGNVRVQEPGKYIVADKAHYNLTTHAGTLDNALYRMSLTQYLAGPNAQEFGYSSSDSDHQTVTTKGGFVNDYGPVAWGKSKKLTQINTNEYNLAKSTFTSCPPMHPSWQIKANTIHLNRDTGRGSAYNSLLYFKGVPVAYTPYINFPIDNRRKTGFLYPVIGYSSDDGLDLQVPIYLNLAPNFDATVTPEIMSQRGLLTTTNLRYLTNSSKVNLDLSFIPHDSEFKSFKSSSASTFGGSTNPATSSELNNLLNDENYRGAISFDDQTQFDEHWSGQAHVNLVSDDYYLNDFSTSLDQSLTNQLLNQAQAQYQGEHWNFTGNVQAYQTLHPVDQSTVINAYTMAPQFTATANYPDLPHGLDLGFDGEYVDFLKDANPGQPNQPAEGQRLNVQPSLSLPIRWGLSGYLTPKVQLQATQYFLYNAGVTNPYLPVGPTNLSQKDRNPSRVLPIASVDGGLYFDRQTHLFGKTYTETLEPRAFYLYVPYENQDNIPLFDTSLQAFTYDLLWQTNRFAGTDRQGDANQVSLGVTTRFLDNATGEQKASASLGEIVYFQNRRVTLCRTSGCSDPVNVIGVTSNSEPVSPLAAQTSYRLNRYWNATVDVAYDPNFHQLENTAVNFQFMTDPRHIINVGYNYIKNGDVLVAGPGGFARASTSLNDLSQPYVSFAWPIYHAWSAIGSFTYNISHDYGQDYFAGIQYNTCCWAFRTVASRQYDHLDQNNNPVFDKAVYIQLLLKGLGSIGTGNPYSTLTGDIPGYKDPFAKSLF